MGVHLFKGHERRRNFAFEDGVVSQKQAFFLASRSSTRVGAGRHVSRRRRGRPFLDSHSESASSLTMIALDLSLIKDKSRFKTPLPSSSCSSSGDRLGVCLTSPALYQEPLLVTPPVSLECRLLFTSEKHRQIPICFSKLKESLVEPTHRS